MPRLTAIVITKNEAGNIADCLDSLAFCDERIVVDGGSTDDTVRIAREQGRARGVSIRSRVSARRRILRLSLAQRRLGAVDRCRRAREPAARRSEIRTAIAQPAADGYEMPRLSSFCGRPMHHSGWSPDYVLRLFRRDKARFSDDLVHERVVCKGRVMRLKQPLIHHPVLRLEDALSRMDRYSTAGAECLLRRAAGSRL